MRTQFPVQKVKLEKALIIDVKLALQLPGTPKQFKLPPQRSRIQALLVRLLQLPATLVLLLLLPLRILALQDKCLPWSYPCWLMALTLQSLRLVERRLPLHLQLTHNK
jgi:hypothetical protein